MERTIIELCPKCGRPLKKEIDERFDGAEVFWCKDCNWRYYRNNEKYTFVTFRSDRHRKPWEKKKAPAAPKTTAVQTSSEEDFTAADVEIPADETI